MGETHFVCGYEGASGNVLPQLIIHLNRFLKALLVPVLSVLMNLTKSVVGLPENKY